jgi:hypothetical protein
MTEAKSWTEVEARVLRRMCRVAGATFFFAVTLGAFLEAARISDPRPSKFIEAAVVSVAATTWCILDSICIRRPFPTGIQAVMIMSWPVALPAYAFWTRGRKAVFVVAAWVVGFYLCQLLGIGLARFLAVPPAGG